MIKDVEEKQFGSSPQECFEEGLPDEDGNYYFEALITESIFCSPDKYTAHTYFNVCKFTTESPISNLNYDKKSGTMVGKLLGNTIELIPMKRYKIQATLERNEKYNEWQYKIIRIWEVEAKTGDELNAYLKFFTNSDKTYNAILQSNKNFVDNILSDDNFVPERPKGVQDRTIKKITMQLREYKDLMPLIAKFSQFPDISLSAIEGMQDLSSNPRQTFEMLKENPYLLTRLPRFRMETCR